MHFLRKINSQVSRVQARLARATGQSQVRCFMMSEGEILCHTGWIRGRR